MGAPWVLATRKSPLALRQAELAAEHLRARTGRACVLLPLSTEGDEKLKLSLETQGGKGVFTRELERALLEERADIAVHSAKDLPVEDAEGLAIAGYLPRADARDVWVVSDRLGAGELPRTIATGSPRRRAQLARIFPDARFLPLRGNVHTRLKKIADGVADGTVLAAAGLERLGVEDYFGLRFDPLPLRTLVPAAGQGAIALQMRSADAPLLAPLLCARTRFAVSVERAALARFGGGCQTAVGAHWSGGTLLIFDEARGLRAHAFPECPEAEIPARFDAIGNL